MSFNAWMPLQGTNSQRSVGKSYPYTTGKNKAASKNASKQAEQDSAWKLTAESYEPSVAAKEYRTEQMSAKKGANGGVELSEAAQNLLKQLKEKYGNMDFFVASYSSEEEAQRYLSRGTKEYSVLIEPETLEAMANDENVRKQYEDILSGAGDKLAQLKEELGKDADQVKSFGISIDNEGKVSYFAELDKISESRRNQVEHAKEKRAEEKAKAAKKAKQDAMKERTDKTRQFVKADTIEDLIEKIRNAHDEEGNVAKNGFDMTM